MKNTKHFKKLLVITLTLVIIALSASFVYANQAETEPVSNVTTFFHEATGTLIVSGTGEVSALYPRTGVYDEYDKWITTSSDDKVKHIIIDEGITSITNSFNDMKSLLTVTFPQTLTSVDYSFMACPEMKSLDFPASLEIIKRCSFNDCTKLENIHFVNKIKLDADQRGTVFGNCTSLKTLYIPGGSKLNGAFSGCTALEKVVLGKPSVLLYEGFICCESHYTYDNFSGAKNLRVYGAEGNVIVQEDSHSWDLVELPVIPDGVKVANTNTGIQVDWDGELFIDTYHLYRKAKGDSKWTKITDTVMSQYLDTDVKSGVEYAYLIKTDDNSEYVASSWNRFVGTPELVSLSNTGKGIKVVWNKVDGAVKYRLYRKYVSEDYMGFDVEYDWEKVADVKGTSYVDGGVHTGGKYKYTVRAYGETNYSKYDTVGLTTIYLAAPKVQTVTNTTEGIKVTWNQVAGCQGYYIYRKEPGGNWVKRGTVTEQTKTYFVDTRIESGKTYTYTVRGFLWDYGHYRSSYYSGETIVCLETPEISSATSTKNGVSLKWNSVKGAQGYRVYRKTGGGSWSLTKVVEGNSEISYVDKTAKKGVTYTYTVRAYNGKTYSGYNSAGKTVKDKY